MRSGWGDNRVDPTQQSPPLLLPILSFSPLHLTALHPSMSSPSVASDEPDVDYSGWSTAQISDTKADGKSALRSKVAELASREAAACEDREESMARAEAAEEELKGEKKVNGE